MALGGLLGPVVALAAGLVSFFSPCVLPLVPVYLAQMAGASSQTGEAPRRRAILLALSFVVGFSVIFVALGASIGLVGYALLGRLPLLIRVAGALVIVLGLQTSGIIRIPWLYRTVQVGRTGGNRTGFIGSTLVGGAFALGWTPCIGPVLSSILALAATRGGAAQGALLLGFYSAGLGVPFLAASLAVGSITRLTRQLGPRLMLLERASGVVLIMMGILLFTDALSWINRLTAGFGIGGI
ncbi:MAG: cytochrome c biogenesis CcdA family protein [Dehalococcoidia bacterium]